VERPSRKASLEDKVADSLRARPRILITGAAGQLGRALADVFLTADARDHAALDVTSPRLDYRPDLVLHAAAWTDVDRAENDPGAAERVNVLGARNIVGLGAPVVYYSTDYVFDGAKRSPYVESDEPAPLSVYGRTKLGGEQEIEVGWVLRSSWLFGESGGNFLRTMLALARDRTEVKVVDDQRGSPTYVGHLAEATARILELPYGTYHLSADGECTWAEFAEAIFATAGLGCRVVRISTADAGLKAPRPQYSVLRTEHHHAPRLPHWREGLRHCLDRLMG
jgi:dTDP-4-dehydrorhamnose reductase